METIMDTFTRNSEADLADIAEVRRQLRLTVHDVALALAGRSGNLCMLDVIAHDLRAEASVLASMATGKTPPRS
jgi:hypothetical protein